MLVTAALAQLAVPLSQPVLVSSDHHNIQTNSPANVKYMLGAHMTRTKSEVSVDVEH